MIKIEPYPIPLPKPSKNESLTLFCIAGCVTFNKSDRKRGAIVIEQRELTNKAKLHIPKIRKPRILKAKEIMSNKDEQQVNHGKTLEEALKEPMTSDEVNMVKGEMPTAQSNKNLSEVERNKRFDNLVELEKEKGQIKEDKGSRLDSWMTWVGAIGVLSVFWTGVYFIVRNLF